jgi:hypothetical protein
VTDDLKVVLNDTYSSSITPVEVMVKEQADFGDHEGASDNQRSKKIVHGI